MAGDPALRWQVLRDLRGAPPDQVAAERDRVAAQGWGARLLAAQDADACWAGALYSPKWTSTTYTLLLLERLGLPSGDPRALAGCQRLWESAYWYGGGLTLARSIREPETCITGMLVLLAASFGHGDARLGPTVEWLVGQQLGDGGWNCESIRRGSVHGSFHTSITVLEAMLAYQQAGGTVPVGPAMAAGREFFLDHQLYRSHRTGAVVDRAFTRFPFPPQWHFDIVRGLEYFRAAGACAASACAARSNRCDEHGGPMPPGRGTGPTRAGSGSRWRAAVRAAGRRCARGGSCSGGRADAAMTCDDPSRCG
jgi:hypothetical protein